MAKLKCLRCRRTVEADQTHCPHCADWSYEQCFKCRGRGIVGKVNPMVCPECHGRGTRHREAKTNLRTGQRERFYDGRRVDFGNVLG